MLLLLLLVAFSHCHNWSSIRKTSTLPLVGTHSVTQRSRVSLWFLQFWKCWILQLFASDFVVARSGAAECDCALLLAAGCSPDCQRCSADLQTGVGSICLWCKVAGDWLLGDHCVSSCPSDHYGWHGACFSKDSRTLFSPVSASLFLGNIQWKPRRPHAFPLIVSWWRLKALPRFTSLLSFQVVLRAEERQPWRPKHGILNNIDTFLRIKSPLLFLITFFTQIHLPNHCRKMILAKNNKL